MLGNSRRIKALEAEVAALRNVVFWLVSQDKGHMLPGCYDLCVADILGVEPNDIPDFEAGRVKEKVQHAPMYHNDGTAAPVHHRDGTEGNS